ncbi:MAG: nuclear transport factor 2 family protein [Gammaproteobacteria bacterium]
MNTPGKYFSGMVLAALLVGCQSGHNADVASTQSLIRTDNAFSALSAQQGFATAFRRYALDDAILLPENRAALQNRNTIEQSLQNLPASTKLSWTLQHADASGDLGYTWGIYTLIGSNTAAQTMMAYGKYLSVWKKQSGDWKLSVMMTNQSPGPMGG